MFFSKYPHPANFVFPERDLDGRRDCKLNFKSFVGDIANCYIAGPDWPECNEILPLLPPPVAPSSHVKSEGMRIWVEDGEGRTVLQTLAGEGFGYCGDTHLFQFTTDPAAEFFGMGEKTFGEVELSGYRTKFWNTDVWSDFHWAQWGGNPTDPPYFTTPFLLIRTHGTYVGILIQNPYPTFMETPGIDESRVFVEWQRTANHLILGAEGGQPNLWIIYGPTQREVVCKLQHLVGVTPRPPLWSLGYHQSRWEYRGEDDVLELDRQFTHHQIPCDGIWMDLDYMKEYRIFTVLESAFPSSPAATAAKLSESGRRIVPITDPGVKKELGYDVYDDGIAQDVFCKTAEGRPYVGIVWPGETVFPDFSQARVRDWWAGYAKSFRESGFGGCWIDMNDPSTGPVDPTEMRFQNGTEQHKAHRNQYALGMQMATYQGFLSAKPNERPFILSRSGFTGSSRFGAIWTGDNVSNRFYLKTSIPTAIGMSLSGLPFAGPDLGGFGGNVSDDLMIDWAKAGFLFPFLRNHCGRGLRAQEPFNLPTKVMAVMRRYIRLRYKLMPWLYNLFVNAEANGDPILRPLSYEFPDSGLERCSDQFLIGDSILQAPFLDDDKNKRTVQLPGEMPWYDAQSGRWLAAGTHPVKKSVDSTPMYIRAGAIIPMQPGTPVSTKVDLLSPQFHVFVPEGWTGQFSYVYVADDGISFDYREGAESRLQIKMISVDGNIAVQVDELSTAFGLIRPSYVFHGAPKSVRINGRAPELVADRSILTGAPLRVTRTTD
jgi:alpha-glucosidase